MPPSCIIPYEPDINIKDINKYVVSGQLSDNQTIQTVLVSMASAVGDPQYIPVSDCYIRIIDDLGNEFTMDEQSRGVYQVSINPVYMETGRSFKISILTRDGTNIESDFDKIFDCPAVDSVYYEIREVPSTIIGQKKKELQFFVDLVADDVDTRYFKWEVVETWEHRAPYQREWFYDGQVHHIDPPDRSRMVCWSTELVKNVYTISTQNLVENRYHKLPLHMLTNQSQKMIHGYSLLINQFAMSESAYSYWDQLRINSSEQGGLYEKQPLAIRGNLHNLTDPSQEVLGYFSVSSVKSKRIFVPNPPDLEIDTLIFCVPSPLEHGGFLEISPWEYPAFLVGDSTGYREAVLSDECVDCLASGGTNIKPAFWPY